MTWILASGPGLSQIGRTSAYELDRRWLANGAPNRRVPVAVGQKQLAKPDRSVDCYTVSVDAGWCDIGADLSS